MKGARIIIAAAITFFLYVAFVGFQHDEDAERESLLSVLQGSPSLSEKQLREQDRKRWKPVNPIPEPYRLPTDYTHVVFIGDSLMRYMFLDFVYRVHHGKSDVPEELYADTFHESYFSFYQYTSKLVDNRLSCDCYRDTKIGLENRYYQHPTRNFTITFLQSFGDFTPFEIFVGPKYLHLARPSIARPDSYRVRLRRGVDYINSLTPKPTHILINFCLWPSVSTTWELQGFLWKARAITPHIYWRMTNPKIEDVPEIPAPSKTLSKYMEKTLTTVGSDAMAYHWCRKGLCNFFAFPIQSICKGAYMDPMHFFGPAYGQWNAALFQELKKTYTDSPRSKHTLAAANFDNFDQLFNMSTPLCNGGNKPWRPIPAQALYSGQTSEPPPGMEYILPKDPTQRHIVLVGGDSMKKIYRSIIATLFGRSTTTTTKDASSSTKSGISGSSSVEGNTATRFRNKLKSIKSTRGTPENQHDLLVDIPSLNRTLALRGYQCEEDPCSPANPALFSYIPMYGPSDFNFAVIPSLKQMNPPAMYVVLQKPDFLHCDAAVENMIGTAYQWATLKAPGATVLWLHSKQAESCERIVGELSSGNVCEVYKYEEAPERESKLSSVEEIKLIDVLMNATHTRTKDFIPTPPVYFLQHGVAAKKEALPSEEATKELTKSTATGPLDQQQGSANDHVPAPQQVMEGKGSQPQQNEAPNQQQKGPIEGLGSIF